MKNRKQIEDRITLFMTNIRKGLSYDANVVLLVNDIEEAIKQGQKLHIHSECSACGIKVDEVYCDVCICKGLKSYNQ